MRGRRGQGGRWGGGGGVGRGGGKPPPPPPHRSTPAPTRLMGALQKNLPLKEDFPPQGGYRFSETSFPGDKGSHMCYATVPGSLVAGAACSTFGRVTSIHIK